MPPPPSDDELLEAGFIRRSRRALRIQSRPRIRQFYWVDFPRDAYAPEFEGEHPGIVVRAASSLPHGTCVVVPVTSKPQAEATHFHKLGRNPNPQGQQEGIEAFAICDHLYTVNNCRLRPILSLQKKPIYPVIDPADFLAISGIIRTVLAPLFDYAVPLEQERALRSELPQKAEKGRKILGLPAKEPL